MNPLFGIFEGLFSPGHLLIFAIIGILLFGKRLPEVGRSLGKGIVEFKKGLKGLEDETDSASYTSPAASPPPPALEPPRPPQRVSATAPKFEDHPPPVQPPPSV
jgi:sec-independent protein translocase protein TatA